MSYNTRTTCIICNSNLQSESLFFKEDLSIPIASYLIDKNDMDECIFIPYNVHTCTNCKTSQTKYIGDLSIIYKHNHADSTGTIMSNLHVTVSNLIDKYIDSITNITEIGSSYGKLSEIILSKFKQINKYYIIEPSFKGNFNEKQIIIPDFFEKIDYTQYSDSNTIIISHVFEHFYNPIEILEKIKNNQNIENIVLVWPDLEYYKNNAVYHVLNTEHTYYVDNNLINILFNNYSFEMIEQIYYENHSVIYYFKRNNVLLPLKIENNDHSISNYFNNLLDKKIQITEFIKNNKLIGKRVCIWPASVHTQFLLMILQLNENDFDCVLDNSINKIGKKLYGYNLICESFKDNITHEHNAIILNGGSFNKEVIENGINNKILLII